MSKTQLHKPIEIKISTVVAVSAILRESDPTILSAAMHDMTGGDVDYFDGEFAVIDVEFFGPAGKSIDWPALITLFKAYRLNLVAVRNATADMEPDILAHGLSLDVVVKSRQTATQQEFIAPPAPVAPVMVPPPAAYGAMIVDTQLRAGQRIYAQGCDLIITAAVNNGAEIIADGSIHVYAALNGRALAGASGNAEARIFALSMQPELVSIAGVYRTFDEGFPPNLARQPAQIRLVGDRIDILSLSPAPRS